MGLKTKLVDLGGDVLKFADKFSLTRKEKAEGLLEYYKTTLGENTLRSKTRRFIAILVVANYLLLINLSIALSILDFKEKADFVFNTANTSLWTAFVMVLAFFFGGYYLNQLKGKK